MNCYSIYIVSCLRKSSVFHAIDMRTCTYKVCRILGSHSFVMRSSIFWDITCSPLRVNRRFGETCLLHLQGRIIKQTRNQREASSKFLGNID
jgi:hypothetical protein